MTRVGSPLLAVLVFSALGQEVPQPPVIRQLPSPPRGVGTPAVQRPPEPVAIAPDRAVDPVTGLPLQPGEDLGPRLDFFFDDTPLSEVIRSVRDEYHKASGDHLNVVVPTHLQELTETNSITLSVKQMTVGELFNILGRASQRAVPYWPGPNHMNYSMGTASYAFNLVSANAGNQTYLLSAVFPPGPPLLPGVFEAPGVAGSRGDIAQPRQVIFYQLEPYLDHFSVDDLTTAIKTGWDLAGYQERPTMKYHEETKLLIASGQTEQLQTIERVLRALDQVRQVRANAAQRPGQPVPVGVPALPPTPAKP